MAGNTGSKKSGDTAQTAEAFHQQLEESGFFDQLHSVERSLDLIAEDLTALGSTATRRLEEIENLAAHMLAVEAILDVLLDSVTVDAEAVHARVRRATADPQVAPEGNPTVLAIVDDLLARGGSKGRTSGT